MTFEKPKVEVMKFDFDAFIRCSGDTPIGSFTCGAYTQGGSCTNISWTNTGYTCGSYTNGNCTNITAPPGSMGDGCHAWNLTCSKF